MGGDIEGRIPDPNSYREEKGGKKEGVYVCESSQVVVTCPPTPMVVVGEREFLRIWGYLSPKCMKTWALVPSNTLDSSPHTIPEMSLRFQSSIYIHPTFAWISLRTSKKPLQGLCNGPCPLPRSSTSDTQNSRFHFLQSLPKCHLLSEKLSDHLV